MAHNFGHDLDGLVTVNVDKESRYRSTVNVLSRPSAEGIELIGHHEMLLPLLHAAVACRPAGALPTAPSVAGGVSRLAPRLQRERLWVCIRSDADL